METELHLTIEDVDGGGVYVAWNDAQPEGYGASIAAFLTLPIVFGVAMSIETGTQAGEFLASVLITIFLGWIPALLVYLVAKPLSQMPARREVYVLPDCLVYEDKTIPLADVSRVEYGTRGEWDRSRLNAQHLSQIRVWEKDRRFIIVGENNWTKAINHEIRDTLAEALAEVRQDEAQAEREAKHGKSDSYGVPDY